MASGNIGNIVQIIGPVLDIRFSPENLPNINNAIHIKFNDRVIVTEVAQHLGDDLVRCVSMSSTDGLVRGMEAEDTKSPIKVPVGEGVLGRVFNVLGHTIDNGPSVKHQNLTNKTQQLKY
jgi:F-type H+-transporting ATPase subunit beta